MIERIRRLGKETAVYGLSTVLGRLLNFVLVPLYANLLTPSENGVVATLYAYIAFIAVVYGMGMEQAYMRFAVDHAPDKRASIFRLAWMSVLPAIGISLIVHIAGTSVANAAGFGPDGRTLIVFAAWILVADAAAAVPFASLRLDRRPLVFATLKLASILLTIVGTLYLVVLKGWRAEGVVAANLVASIITFVCVVFVTRSTWMGPKSESGTQWKDLWRFALPLMPAGLAGIALQVVDRPIVRALTDDATVGIYQLNYRLGIFMMLAVGMFDYAWRPFFLQQARDEDAKPLFSRVFTYLVTLMATIFLAVSLFVEDLVRLPIGGGTFFPSTYWEGTMIVPIVLAAYACTGAYVVFLTGVYLEKRTGIVPVIAGVSAVVNIIADLIFVPVYGIMGAAIATLAGHGVQVVWMYWASRKYLHIVYEWNRVIRAIVWSGAIYIGFLLMSPSPLTAIGLGFKVLCLCLFVGGLFVFKIIRWSEFKEIRLEPTGPSNSQNS